MLISQGFFDNITSPNSNIFVQQNTQNIEDETIIESQNSNQQQFAINKEKRNQTIDQKIDHIVQSCDLRANINEMKTLSDHKLESNQNRRKVHIMYQQSMEDIQNELKQINGSCFHGLTQGSGEDKQNRNVSCISNMYPMRQTAQLGIEMHQSSGKYG